MAILKEVPRNHLAITTGSDFPLPGSTCVGVYVGVGGDLDLEDQTGTSAVYKPGNDSIIPGKFTKMVDATTTATNMIALLA